MKCLFLLLFELVFLLHNIEVAVGKNEIPVLNLDHKVRFAVPAAKDAKVGRKARAFGPKSSEYLPFELLINKDMDKDTSEYWRETEILTLVRNREAGLLKDFEKCTQNPQSNIVQFATRRSVRPICKTSLDYQLCPQCPRFNNHTECELFRDSCKERRVHPSEYPQYCDRKYGKFRTMFIPADYSNCRCCDECIEYREMDQSCVNDDYSFESDEFLPVTTLVATLLMESEHSNACTLLHDGRLHEQDGGTHPDGHSQKNFRAGCNPYWGHPEQELKALKCDKMLRRCVPINIPTLPNDTITHTHRRNYRFEAPTDVTDCPISCRGYNCYGGLVTEEHCAPGAFLPHKEKCNCCGSCSTYQQLNQKCANFKKTVHVVKNGTEIEIEEEFLDPGCDDGLVCRQGVCQDIHTVQVDTGSRRKRHETLENPKAEPCKKEMKYFKKKYGKDGQLHFNAPQCTPLWLYSPVQCRRFVCYCALEDGTFIEGIKVPRVEVSNMNCDCAREKCRTDANMICDGYGNYKEAVFTPHVDDWATPKKDAADKKPEQKPVRTVLTVESTSPLSQNTTGKPD